AVEQDFPESLESVLKNRWEEFSGLFAKDMAEGSRNTAQLKLYAAARRLSEAMEENTVPDAILEIGSNLLGCEQIAILSLPRKTKEKLFIRSTGLTADRVDLLRKQAQEILEAIPEGEFYIRGNSSESPAVLRSHGISAQVPLWQNSEMKGAVLFFDLLPQRNG